MGGNSYLIDRPRIPELLEKGFVLPRIMNVEMGRKFFFDKNGPFYCFPEIEVIGFVNTK